MTKSRLFIPAALALLAAGPVQAADGQACVRLHDLKTLQATDDSHVEMVARNGTVWRSDLGSPCLGIARHGFSFASPDGDICGDAALVHVNTTGDVCRLGPLVKQTPAPSR